MCNDKRNELVDYLAKKDIDIYFDDYNDLVWEFQIYYTKFKISMDYHSSQYNDDYITYYSNNFIRNIKTRRTSVPKHDKNYRRKVYNNLVHFKEQLVPGALSEKNETDLKTEYCTEIERHYKRKHKHINVSSFRSNKGCVFIRVTGYDNNYFNDTEYEIEYQDKKYFLTNKKVNKKIEISMESL